MLTILLFYAMSLQDNAPFKNFEELRQVLSLIELKDSKFNKSIIQYKFDAAQIKAYVLKNTNHNGINYTTAQLEFLYHFLKYRRLWELHEEIFPAIPKKLSSQLDLARIKIGSEMDEFIFLNFHIFSGVFLNRYYAIKDDFILRLVNQELAERYLKDIIVTRFVYSLNLFVGENIYVTPNEKTQQIIDYLESITNPFLKEKIDELKRSANQKRSLNLDAQVVNQGETFALSELMDSPYTIVDCWASWCRPCIKSFPKIDKIIANEKIPVIAVCTDEPQRCDRRIKKSKFKHINLVRPKDSTEVFHNFEPVAFPTYLIVDQKGEIISQPYHRFDEVLAKTKELMKQD